MLSKDPTRSEQLLNECPRHRDLGMAGTRATKMSSFGKSQTGAPQPGSFRALRINDSVDTTTKEGNSLEQQAGKVYRWLKWRVEQMKQRAHTHQEVKP